MGLVTSQSEWDAIVHSYNGSFLQSWQWGEFQASVGRPVYRWNGEDMACQWIVHSLPFNKAYAFSPYGPLGNGSLDDCANAIQQHTNEPVLFWRLEPTTTAPAAYTPVPDIHPKYSWVIQLQEPDVMLAAMKSKWRYNIRLAAKKGVAVRRSNTVEDMKKVYGLLAATAKRQSITIHSEQYYTSMVEHDMVDIYIAEHEGTVIAGAIMIGYGNTYTYVHGGATYEHRSLMAPHAVQWAALQHAQASGYSTYDFFGVAPPNYKETHPNHPWAGITRFKYGFGGEYTERAGTVEYPLQPMWYTMYKLGKRFRSG